MRSTPKVPSGGGPPRRRTLIGFYTVVAALLIPAAIAYACNPQAQMRCAKGCQTGPGETLNVSGTYFQTNTGLTLTVNGAPAATVTTNSGGAFSTSIQTPTQPGSYTLLAKRSDGVGRSGLPARLSFEVQAASVTTPQGTQPQAVQEPQQGPAFSEPGVVDSPAQDRAGNGGRERSTPNTPSNTPGGTPGTSAPITQVPAIGGSGSVPSVSGDTGSDVFAGSVAPTGSSTTDFGTSPAQDQGATGASGRSAAGSPSEAAAGGDVWSGFGSGSNASLLPSATDAAPDNGGTGSGFGWGIGLLALGLVGLVSGVAVAEVRRRRALAGS